MGAGGATSATAGTLGIGPGSGNPFDLGDVTEVGDFRPYNHAWWIHSPAEDHILTLDTRTSVGAGELDTIIQVYNSGTEPAELDDWRWRNDDIDDSSDPRLSELSLPARAGNTYLILVGTYASAGGSIPTEYRLAATAAPFPDLDPAPNGGASALTSGTLVIGANAFNAGDVTDTSGGVSYINNGAPSSNQPPFNRAWWSYDHTVADARVTLDLTGSDTIDAVTPYVLVLWADQYVAYGFGVVSFAADQGKTYTVVIGTEFSGEDQLEDIFTYRITVSRRAYIYSDWYDDLRDAETHFLIISDGTAVDLNPNPGYSSLFMPSWTDPVIRSGQERRSEYSVQEVLGGEVVYPAALPCVVEHAMAGERENDLWNGGGGVHDTSPGVCKEIPTGAADSAGTASTTKFSIGYNPGSDIGMGTSGFLEAESRGPSYAVWYLPVRDALPPYGVLFGDDLNTLEPESHGHPVDADVVWEGKYVDLISIEASDGDRVEDAEAQHSNRWAYNEPYNPLWDNSEHWTGPWQLGNTLNPNPATPEGVHFYFDYFSDVEGEDPSVTQWWPVPFAEGWDWSDGYGPDSEAVDPDGIFTGWPFGLPPIYGDLTETDFLTQRPARIALKFNLRARRFRFRWIEPEPTYTAIPPRRVGVGRPGDGLTGATRAGAGPTVQRGLRVGPGAIL